MNIKKITIMLISALCISFNYGFAQVNDNINVNKIGSSSFSASILLPLTVHDIQPRSLGPREYVKNAEYVLINSLGGTPYCQYTIHGAVGKNMYVKVMGSTVGSDGKEIKDNGNGVTLYVSWTIDDGFGDFAPYSGSNHTPYVLFDQSPELYGARVMTAHFNKLYVAPNAVSGIHVFDQTIEVSYNPGF